MVPIVELIRLEECEDTGTLGVLKINKQIFCFTLEPPDRVNQPNISSIPAQQYWCEPYVGPRHGATWVVKDVPQRSAILFHAGGTIANTAGCILLGETIDKLNNSDERRALLNSGRTFERFKKFMTPYYRFHLTIREIY